MKHYYASVVLNTQALPLYFLRLGSLGFGGPVALVARMERELVEERGWFTRDEFQDGIALAQIAPGPLAAQLAMYLGWVRGGARGATLAAVAFVLPSFLMVAAISVGYLAAGGAPWLRAAFYGVGAVVIAILVRSSARLLQRTLGRDPLLITVAAINGVLVALSGREVVSILLLTAAFPVLWDLSRQRLGGAAALPMLVALPAPREIPGIGEMLAFFAKSSLVVFGSGLAIIPFLRAEVVDARGWLTEPQFLDAIAVAMITPGPVVITVAFIGWLAAGALGGVAAAAGVFAPTWLVVILMTPWFQRLRERWWLRRLATGITAAATGALAGAVLVISRAALTDATTVGLALAAGAALVAWKRFPEPLLILAGAAAGLILSS